MYNAADVSVGPLARVRDAGRPADWPGYFSLGVGDTTRWIHNHEPWHITAGVAYLRTGEYYLNPEHPPLVKLIAGLAAPRNVFRFVEPTLLHDTTAERRFVEETMYERNDADFVQSRARRAMFLFNGLLLLLFGLSAFRVFGGAVALGALAFALIDPTVAAH